MRMMACQCSVPLEPLRPEKRECLKCGRAIEGGRGLVGDDEVADFFDRLAEAPIPDFDAFRLHCELRERWGRAHFGLRYLGRDNSQEAKEEAADGANYAMFGIAVLERVGYNHDEAGALFEAAHHFALAHAALRRAQAQRFRD